jgi:hypothetical protein
MTSGLKRVREKRGGEESRMRREGREKGGGVFTCIYYL